MSFLKSLFGVKSEPEDPKKKEEQTFDSLKYNGVGALKTNQLRVAIDCLQKALELRDDLEVRDYLSQALIRNGELLPAYEQLQKLSEAEPDNIEIWLRMADVAYMMEDYVQVGNACEKAMLIDKDNPRALDLYARAAIGQGDLVNAIAMLTKAISIAEKPKEGEEGKQGIYLDARLLRARTYLQQGDVEGARLDADLLYSRLPDNEDVLLLCARVAEAEGKHKEAIDFYTKAIEANPFCQDAFSERGAIRKEMGDEEGAAEDERAAMELNPEKE